VVSSAYLRLLIFLLAILIPACASSRPAFLMMYSVYKLIERSCTRRERSPQRGDTCKTEKVQEETEEKKKKEETEGTEIEKGCKKENCYL